MPHCQWNLRCLHVCNISWAPAHGIFKRFLDLVQGHGLAAALVPLCLSKRFRSSGHPVHDVRLLGSPVEQSSAHISTVVAVSSIRCRVGHGLHSIRSQRYRLLLSWLPADSCSESGQSMFNIPASIREAVCMPPGSILR